MTGEIITMIGVGLALAAFNWRVMVGLGIGWTAGSTGWTAELTGWMTG